MHSFTDLGLSGQLLIYLLAFLGISIFYIIKAWRELPATEEEISAYSREFWIFMGATILCLAAFQVLVPTSIPVYNALIEAFGGISNTAPPADQVEFYTKFQLWFGVAIALLSGTGQFFWWQKMDKDRLMSAITLPIIITLVASSIIILFGKITNIIYIILLTSALYSVISNSFILIKLAKQKVKLTGGAVTHIGIALMLIGILFSSGYSKVISLNTTGLLYNREFPEEMNKENLLLFRNNPQRMLDYASINQVNDVNDPNAKFGYTLVYKGPRMESEEFPEFIDKEILLPTLDPFKVVLKEDLVYKGETYHERGDTIQVYNENTYYEIEYTRANGKKFSLFPRIQNNPQMGFVPSPDIRTFPSSDLYTHITNIADPESETEWSEPEQFTLAIGDTFIVNDYIAVLDNVVRTEDLVEVQLNEGDVAVKAEIRILGNGKNFDVQPVYLIKDRQVGMLPDILPDLGLKIQFEKIDPETGTFTLMAQTTQKDWVILKAIEKPFINVLWIGTLIMSMGFCIAIYRRFNDLKEKKTVSIVKSSSKKNKSKSVSKHKMA
ncbi:MAG: cytochrome c-type biogenesis CcmF C-terminal domain-containing protein [Bacteroidota bacterium]